MLRVGVQDICKLLNDVHDSNPAQCSKEQRKSVKKLLIQKEQRQIEYLVDEYRALVDRYGTHEKIKILEGILDFVE